MPDPVDYETRLLADQFLSVLSPSALILDIGCGSGMISRYLADGGYNVLGIDLRILPWTSEGNGIGGIELPLAPFRAFEVRDIMSGGRLHLMEVDVFEFVPSCQFEGITMFSFLNYLRGERSLAAIFDMASSWLTSGGYLAASWIDDRIEFTRELDTGCIPAYELVEKAALMAGFSSEAYWHRDITHSHGNDLMDETLNSVEHEHSFSFGLWRKCPS